MSKTEKGHGNWVILMTIACWKVMWCGLERFIG